MLDKFEKFSGNQRNEGQRVAATGVFAWKRNCVFSGRCPLSPYNRMTEEKKVAWAKGDPDLRRCN